MEIRAKNDVVFLRRLIEELNKIKRLDLVLKILSDPDIKRLINRHPTTPLISRVTDDEEQSLARKSRKCTCVCLLMMAIFLLVLVTLIAFEVAMTVSVAEFALKKQSDVEKIVAEGDSVSLCNIDQMYINMIEISEAVRKGDSGHSIKIVLVPTDSLIFEVAYGLDYSNGSAIVKDLPIINEISVRLPEQRLPNTLHRLSGLGTAIRQSQLHYTFLMMRIS